jgi:hypothetical protein
MLSTRDFRERALAASLKHGDSEPPKRFDRHFRERALAASLKHLTAPPRFADYLISAGKCSLPRLRPEPLAGSR